MTRWYLGGEEWVGVSGKNAWRLCSWGRTPSPTVTWPLPRDAVSTASVHSQTLQTQVLRTDGGWRVPSLWAVPSNIKAFSSLSLSLQGPQGSLEWRPRGLPNSKSCLDGSQRPRCSFPATCPLPHPPASWLSHSHTLRKSWPCESWEWRWWMGAASSYLEEALLWDPGDVLTSNTLNSIFLTPWF